MSWISRKSYNIATFESGAGWRRAAKLVEVGVTVVAALMGLGALKAVLKGAGLFGDNVGQMLSDVMIPLGAGLAALVLLAGFAVMIAASRPRA